MDDDIKKISILLHEMFVINDSAAAIQQEDGRYITKYFPFNAFVIESMLRSRGAIGCYQQSYYTGFVKWICVDFDCKDKDKPDVAKLYDKYVVEFLKVLKKHKISYLTEFSGRRGIHVWVHFNESIPKNLAYKIINKLYNQFPFRFECEFLNEFGVDLFPATDSAKGNKVGKQVKIPLSFHTQGLQSFLFEEKMNLDSIYEVDFFCEQKRILEEHKINEVDNICSELSLPRDETLQNNQRFKKFKILEDISCSADEVENILSETIVFYNIFERLKKGVIHNQDWFVILGTLGLIDISGEILHSIFSKSPAYNQEISSRMIEQWRTTYSPATFGYLYTVYGLEVEPNLDENITGLEYLLKKLSRDNAIELDQINTISWRSSELDILNDIKCTVEKECKYIMYNDENVDISIWNDLNNIKGYDLIKLEKQFNEIANGNKVNVVDIEMISYERREKADKIRLLVSLGGYERIITTHIALQLAYKFNKKIKSFSYNVVFISKKDIFYNWYTSWKNYVGQIRMFMEIPYLSEWNVMTIDIKGFYDCIDFLSVYNMFQKYFGESERNMFKYLIKFNDEIMKEINGNRIGVPQGPAYARIISEIFLSTVLENISEFEDKENCRMYRYVDDIVIFYTKEIDGNMLFNKIRHLLKENGMDVNSNKSRNFGYIKSLTSDNRKNIMKSNTFNYHLQISEDNMILMDSEKTKKFNEVINESFDINEAGYIFGKKTDDFFTRAYFKKFKYEIFSETDGRGSIFASFYRFLFSNLSYFEESIRENYFILIDFNSINFKNCISQMYLAIQNRHLKFENVMLIEKCFFDKIDMNLLCDDERTTIKSITQWRKNNG